MWYHTLKEKTNRKYYILCLESEKMYKLNKNAIFLIIDNEKIAQ